MLCIALFKDFEMLFSDDLFDPHMILFLFSLRSESWISISLITYDRTIFHPATLRARDATSSSWVTKMIVFPF